MTLSNCHVKVKSPLGGGGTVAHRLVQWFPIGIIAFCFYSHNASRSPGL